MEEFFKGSAGLTLYCFAWSSRSEKETQNPIHQKIFLVSSP